MDLMYGAARTSPTCFGKRKTMVCKVNFACGYLFFYKHQVFGDVLKKNTFFYFKHGIVTC